MEHGAAVGVVHRISTANYHTAQTMHINFTRRANDVMAVPMVRSQQFNSFTPQRTHNKHENETNASHDVVFV